MLGSSEVKQNQFHEILGFCSDVDVFITLGYDTWCCVTDWLVHNILGQNAGFIFSVWEIQCKIKYSLDFLTHEDETNVLFWNVRHHSPSDTMPYLRGMKTVMNSVGKVVFWSWDWNEWIFRLNYDLLNYDTMHSC